MPLPTWWKALAKAECKRQFGSYDRLAAKVGCSQAGITQAFAVYQPTSKYARAISRALNIPEPVIIPESQEHAALIARLMAAAVTVSAGSPDVLDRAVAALEAQVALLEGLAATRKP